MEKKDNTRNSRTNGVKHNGQGRRWRRIKQDQTVMKENPLQEKEASRHDIKVTKRAWDGYMTVKKSEQAAVSLK